MSAKKEGATQRALQLKPCAPFTSRRMAETGVSWFDARPTKRKKHLQDIYNFHPFAPLPVEF